MPVTRERLTNQQVAVLKHLAACCGNGTLVTLTRSHRAVTPPLWRRGLVEVWQKIVPDEGSRGPFYRPTQHGWRLIDAILASKKQVSAEAA